MAAGRAEARVRVELLRQVEAERSDPEMRVALLELDMARPRTRGQCRNGLRPCPFIGCRYSLVADVNVLGGIVFTFPDKAVTAVRDTCALDIADRGEHSSEEVAALLNITHQRVEQLQTMAMKHMASELTWLPDCCLSEPRCVSPSDEDDCDE